MSSEERRTWNIMQNMTMYTCRNRQKLKAGHFRHCKSKTGYVSKKTIYKFEEAAAVPIKMSLSKGIIVRRL